MSNSCFNEKALLKIFESEVVGETLNEESYTYNEKIIEYLKEANVSSKDVFDFVINHNPKDGDRLKINNLPESIWESSLIDRDTFYFNNNLKLVPKLVGPGEKMKVYREPKIVVTELDVVEYFYKKNRIPVQWMDKQKEEGAVRHLIDNFKKFNFVQPIDFLYSIIDYVSNAKSLFDLKKHEIEFAEMFERDVRAARIKGVDSIIWRFEDEQSN